MKLLNSTTYEGKEYTVVDGKGFISIAAMGIPTGFYGGRVTKLAKTDIKGLYLCMEDMDVIDIIIKEDEFGKEIVEDKEEDIPFDQEIDYYSYTNDELRNMLSEMGIEVPKRANKDELVAMFNKEGSNV